MMDNACHRSPVHLKLFSFSTSFQFRMRHHIRSKHPIRLLYNRSLQRYIKTDTISKLLNIFYFHLSIIAYQFHRKLFTSLNLNNRIAVSCNFLSKSWINSKYQFYHSCRKINEINAIVDFPNWFTSKTFYKCFFCVWSTHLNDKVFAKKMVRKLLYSSLSFVVRFNSFKL